MELSITDIISFYFNCVTMFYYRILLLFVIFPLILTSTSESLNRKVSKILLFSGLMNHQKISKMLSMIT